MTNIIFASKEEIKKAGEQLKQTSPTYAPMIDFYLELFLAQEDSQQNSQENLQHKLALDSMFQDSDIVNKKNEHDMPLMDLSGFSIDFKEAETLMGILCKLAREKAPKLADSAAILARGMEEGRVDMKNLSSALLKEDDETVSRMADSLGLPHQDLAFFAFTAMAPSIRMGGQQAGLYLEKEVPWNKGYCPVCGNIPSLGFLDQDGRKHLVCGFCMHTWQTKRIGCLFCGTKENTGYFYSKEEKAYRVDMCDHCKRYMKMVDLRELPRSFYPPLEQLCTLHLDMQALDRGYVEGPTDKSAE